MFKKMKNLDCLRRRITFPLFIKSLIGLCLFYYFVILSTNDSTNVGRWVHPRCNCSKDIANIKSGVIVNSTCPYADFRGPHQKVMSYSFYGDINSKYFTGVPINAEAIAFHYPGWTMRLYHNTAPTDASAMSTLCKEVCRFPHLDECYVGDIKHQFENITNTFGMLWRFLVLGDPTVDTFNVRDTDSPLYQREVDAVNDWLATNKTWHIMRDHHFHSTTILGGMWGARNNFRNISDMRNVVNAIITTANGQYKQLDQQLLDKIVWPVAKLDMVAHDSYFCQYYPDTKPWPSPRINDTFVGQTDEYKIDRVCPAECRPKNHQDWIYC